MNCDVIFAEMPKRSQLLAEVLPEGLQKIRVNVHRNHSFEMIENAIAPFLAFAGLSAEFVYSDYDDSLNFYDLKPADLELLWLDVERYKNVDLSAFLKERIAFLQQKSKAPVLLVYTGERDLSGLKDAGLLNFALFDAFDAAGKLGKDVFDLAKEPFSGTRLSNKASILLAQKLGLQYIPALLKPNLKAVAVDLDNTLYEGILGEDGIDNLVLTEAHRKLQEEIKKLKEKGFFIAVASKNEEEDARKMFARREDFPLRFEDFTTVKINWDGKAGNIAATAKDLNIGTDAILFIDDNPAEIQNVEMAGLNVKTILASSPEKALRELCLYPGMLKLKSSSEDAIRNKDIQANLERQNLAKQLSPEEYFKKLGIKLEIVVNPFSRIGRVSELLRKTNQFIYNYRRYTESEVEALMKAQSSCVVTAAMSDNLSDSGIIAILAAKRDSGNRLVVDEMTVSCRALGRNIENPMLFTLLKAAQQKLACGDEVIWPYKQGERNMPALNWLQNIVKQKIAGDGEAALAMPSGINTNGLKLIIREEEE